MSEAPVTLVYLCLEVAGCPTVCRHCWAQGNGYGMMPLAEIEWVLARAHEYCDGRGLGFHTRSLRRRGLGRGRGLGLGFGRGRSLRSRLGRGRGFWSLFFWPRRLVVRGVVGCAHF